VTTRTVVSSPGIASGQLELVQALELAEATARQGDRVRFFACGVHTPAQGRLTPGQVLCCAVRSRQLNRSRRPRAGGTEKRKATLTGALAPTKPLTALDLCDRCGAQAYVRVLLPNSGELLFCAHHGREHAAALAKVAVDIQDESQKLTVKPETN
jgi:hypothetical protein